MYGKLCCLLQEKSICWGRVSPQASRKGGKSNCFGASFLLRRRPRHVPAVRVCRQWIHTAHKRAHKYTRHAQAAPAPSALKNARSEGPWLLVPTLGSRGKEFLPLRAPAVASVGQPGREQPGVPALPAQRGLENERLAWAQPSLARD